MVALVGTLKTSMHHVMHRPCLANPQTFSAIHHTSPVPRRKRQQILLVHQIAQCQTKADSASIAMATGKDMIIAERRNWDCVVIHCPWSSTRMHIT